MPTWGLTSEQREARPWNIPPDLLLPDKTVTDPVHGDVYLNRLETLLVNSPPMQRLRRVRQLGTTQLVYPGATQSRFSHALGTLRAVQDLLDAVWNSQTNPQSARLESNLLADWHRRGILDAEFGKATVLARLGGLLHDLCHIPLGHTIEDDLRILNPHDADYGRFQRLWRDIDPEARKVIRDADGLFDELRVLIISKDQHAKDFKDKSQYPFVQDIVGNTICADLIDYIQRDHHNTGLPLALGHRFLDSFYVPREHPYFAKRMVINIDRDGRRRDDVVTELIKYLRYRYELTERVLTHHAKTAADAMVGKMLELWHDDLWVAAAFSEFQDELGEVDGSSVQDVRKAVRNAFPRRRRDSDGQSYNVAERGLDRAVQRLIEEQFLQRSDDGMLEYIAGMADGTASSRLQAASGLGHDLLNRRLFKVVGRANDPGDHASAEEAFERFATDPDARRDLEARAAKFANLDSGWKCVLWLPNPDMRLKVARVLVRQGGTIAELSRIDETSQSLVDQHHRLWAATLYAPADIAGDPDRRDALLAYVADETGLRFRRPDGTRAESRFELAVKTVLRDRYDLEDKHDQLLELAKTNAKDGESFDGLVTAVKRAAKARGVW